MLGFKVITFKNPYLGNTCVPFQHWACSIACATAIEIPARKEQITAASALDKEYDKYVSHCNNQYMISRRNQSKSFFRRSRRAGGDPGDNEEIATEGSDQSINTSSEELQSFVQGSNPPSHPPLTSSIKKKSVKSKRNRCVLC